MQRIAILAFPGSNGETENIRCFRRNGFDAFVFRWNDSLERLDGVDGYFIGAGFSYEDRGRAGMVAAQDPLFAYLHEEAARGKVIVGHCNGCQVLVESELIPLGRGLRMSLARNIVQTSQGIQATGFLNTWVHITPTCGHNRCCGSDWKGTVRIPIAHGEGRFVTKDHDLLAELKERDQIAFRYCDAEGNISSDMPITPNGSTDAIAGICNPTGNVVAMMPHPERTENGDPYFQSIRRWMESSHSTQHTEDITIPECSEESPLLERKPQPVEIFIDTVIVNNEERTLEAAARRIVPDLSLKQLRYLAPSRRSVEDVLQDFSLFNPNKEIAFVRENGKWRDKNPLTGIVMVRRDQPDVAAGNLGEGSETGVCYCLSNVEEGAIRQPALQHIFSNPHSSTLEHYA